MGAVICEIQQFETEVRELPITQFFARGVSAGSGRRCPFCESIIYSRRHRLCGVCNEALPRSCLFSEEQAQSVEILMHEERQRHRQWLRKFH
jgi:predicted nucleic acid-binding Zn ribbon protein